VKPVHWAWPANGVTRCGVNLAFIADFSAERELVTCPSCLMIQWPPENPGPPHDPVNHPAHYQAGGIEAVDVIEAFGLGYHLGNVVKYVLRAGRKGSALEDAKKAKWYLERAIAAMEKKQG
jgi:hypothetical protein